MVRVGDVIHLSSTRLVIEEHDSDDHPAATDGVFTGRGPRPDLDLEETQGFSGRASAEDMVSLLVTTAAAVRRGAIGEPLSWAVERLGLEALVVLYRDSDGSVSMVTGDLGLIRSSDALADCARARRQAEPGSRISGSARPSCGADATRPHSGRTRGPHGRRRCGAVIAAVEAVLGSGNPPCQPAPRRRPSRPGLRRWQPLRRMWAFRNQRVQAPRGGFALSGRPVLLGEPAPASRSSPG
jgi:hypothetical protein